MSLLQLKLPNDYLFTQKAITKQWIIHIKKNNLLAASINLLYNSKVITGMGSMRKYCLRAPHTMFMSSYADKLTESLSGIRKMQ